MQTNIQRKQYIDVIRLFAIILVIYNHLPAFNVYTNTTGATRFVSCAFSSFVGIDVPLFFMISGAMMLKRDYTYNEILKKVFRFVSLVVIFELAIYLEYSLKHLFYDESYIPNAKDFINGLLANTIEQTYSFWFMYAYICMLLMLPFLRKIASLLTGKDIIALLILRFLALSFIPYSNAVLGHISGSSIEVSPELHAPIASVKLLFFPLLGYYVDNIDLKKISKKHVLIGLIVVLLCVNISALFTIQYGKNYGFATDIKQIFILDYINAPIIFIIIKKLVLQARENSKLINVLAFIGTLTFGVYLFDPILKGVLYYDCYTLININNVFIRAIGWILITLTVGGLITYILKKIPFMKKVL